MAPPPADSNPAEAFERLVTRLDPPLFIVTAAHPDGSPAGCLVGFATQFSVQPARFLAFISKSNHTHDAAVSADVVVVHLVPGRGVALAEHFGGRTADEIDKFADVEWEPGPGGAPLLAACPDWFAGKVVDRIDHGDHTGLILEPVAGETKGEGRGLGLQAALDIEPGHDP